MLDSIVKRNERLVWNGAQLHLWNMLAGGLKIKENQKRLEIEKISLLLNSFKTDIEFFTKSVKTFDS